MAMHVLLCMYYRQELVEHVTSTTGENSSLLRQIQLHKEKAADMKKEHQATGQLEQLIMDTWGNRQPALSMHYCITPMLYGKPNASLKQSCCIGTILYAVSYAL